ncbi:MAG: virulence protein SciE type, partial [Planctomycetes bacterium]|nr:virulence protein SciE type [Planctomycetota bacterium]
MEVVELLRRGELQAAIEAATNGVRRAPADIDQRYSLVALLAMQGELDRADSHLEAIGSLRPDLAFAVSVYRSCL